SWPTSYFIKTYGKFWLESTGFSLNAAAFAASARRTVMLLGIWQGIVLAIRRNPELNYRTVLRIALFVLAAAQLFSSLAWREALLAVFFPRDMVLYIAIATVASWGYFFWHPEMDRSLAVATSLSVSRVLAFWIVLTTTPYRYALYSHSPPIICLFFTVLPFPPSRAVPWSSL